MYSRSSNEEDRLNTRCLYCFMTIASDVKTVRELEQIEARHICPEKALALFLAHKQIAPFQPPTSN